MWTCHNPSVATGDLFGYGLVPLYERGAGGISSGCDVEKSPLTPLCERGEAWGELSAQNRLLITHSAAANVTSLSTPQHECVYNA